jgi:hypothetical protein
MRKLQSMALALACVSLASALLVCLTSSASVYDPWYDTDDDGDIDIFDMVRVAGSYGTTGTPYEAKAAPAYDSGWMNFTDLRGQYFNITHNLDSTNVIFNVTGRESSDSEPHPNFYGLTTHIIADPGWNHTYGQPYSGSAYSMVQTSDGGYALAGTIDAQTRGVWLVKTDAVGNHLWNKTYGDFEYPSDALGASVIQTSDGGYAIAGATTDNILYGRDVWLIKTDAAGNHLWNKTYGDPDIFVEDFGRSVVQTTDGGYAIGGYTSSMIEGNAEILLIKTDAAGNLLWNTTYGGSDGEWAYSIIRTADGGYALAGSTYSYNASDENFYVVKTDADGVMQWNKTYGGLGFDTAYALIQTMDGGYALAGDYDVGEYVYDFWLVKTDAVGNHLWNKTYGGHGVMDADWCRSVVQTTDGGYTIAGTTTSYGAGNGDAWLVKTDADGNYVWNKTYGGSGYENAYALVQTSDGGYVMAGTSNGYFWLAKTFGPGEAPMLEVWLAWTASTENTITLYRGAEDPYWNYVRVRIWTIRDTP